MGFREFVTRRNEMISDWARNGLKPAEIARQLEDISIDGRPCRMTLSQVYNIVPQKKKKSFKGIIRMKRTCLPCGCNVEEFPGHVCLHGERCVNSWHCPIALRSRKIY